MINNGFGAFCNKKSVDNKYGSHYTEFALNKQHISEDPLYKKRLLKHTVSMAYEMLYNWLILFWHLFLRNSVRSIFKAGWLAYAN